MAFLKPSSSFENVNNTSNLTVNLAENIDSLTKSLEIFHNEHKSPCCFEDLNNSLNDIEVIIDDKSESTDEPESSLMSESFVPLDKIEIMDMKLNKLFDMYENYNKLLSEVKESMTITQEFIENSEKRYMKIVYDACNDAVLKFLSERIKPIIIENDRSTQNNNAKLLLEALQLKNRTKVDCMIEASLTELLQSDRLRDQMVSATMSSLNETIQKTFSSDMSSMYLPLLESGNYKLLRRVSSIMYNAVKQIQVKACLMSKPTPKVYRQLNWSLEKHRRVVNSYSWPLYDNDYLKTMKDEVYEAVSKKICDWRDSMPINNNTLLLNSPSSLSSLDFPSVLSSPTVSSSQFTIFDDIMSSKPSQDNTINRSFEEALSAQDVAGVVALCKSNDATHIFSPCRLKQNVLLSLVQQLSTDLAYETLIKLRYMEESVINLKVKDDITRRFLPTVAEDVHNNLSTFLNKYPHHLHGRRVQMLMLAVESLMKINL